MNRIGTNQIEQYAKLTMKTSANNLKNIQLKNFKRAVKMIGNQIINN